MPNKQQYNFIQYFLWIYKRLEKKKKVQLWMLMSAMMFSAIFETISLGSVALFASTITDSSSIISSKPAVVINNFNVFLITEKNIIFVTGILMIILVGLKNGFKAVVIYSITRFGVSVETFFGNILLKGFLTLPFDWHLQKNSADLVNAISWRTFLGSGFFQPCLNIFNNFFLVSLMLIALLIVQPAVSLIVITVLGGTSFFIYKVVKVQIDKFNTIAKNYQLLINKESTMAIHGIKDVKILQKEESFILQFIRNTEPLSKILAQIRFLSSSPVMLLETMGFMMLCLAIFTLLLWGDSSSAYTTGIMTLLAVTAWKALPAINQILSSITIARNALPYISNQIEYVNQIELKSRVLTKDTALPLNFDNSIKFEDVCFSYENQKSKIFEKLNFEILKGETIGIIGASGAGKSTLVNLLIGLLSPNQGSIQIDGKSLSKHVIDRWLNITGYVQQAPYIYDGTIANNVAFGFKDDDIDEERVIDSCHKASMDDFLGDLPDGINSFVGERGVKLSGGQQQRIAIARALYKKPQVMIFDEATSSLDTKSEKLIQETIYSFKGKHTLIIIAHRLSTVKSCDRVIWLENGKIKMDGKPEKVLNEYKQPEKRC